MASPAKKLKQKDLKFLSFAKCGERGYAITAERQVRKVGWSLYISTALTTAKLKNTLKWVFYGKKN